MARAPTMRWVVYAKRQIGSIKPYQVISVHKSFNHAKLNVPRRLVNDFGYCRTTRSLKKGDNLVIC